MITTLAISLYTTSLSDCVIKLIEIDGEYGLNVKWWISNENAYMEDAMMKIQTDVDRVRDNFTHRIPIVSH